MRIIGQNILCCRVKGCAGGEKNKSLILFVEESRIVEKNFDPELVLKMIDWMDWFNLQQVAKQVSNTYINYMFCLIIFLDGRNKLP